MLGRLHLIRHGEVLNPDRLVYADLAGFHLGERGRAEAAAIAAYLAAEPIEVIAVSPLERAVESAA
ncbi:MAG: histidine phosphatase family protein, partial [Actinobacteria bacterium]|nr:histidine phosphatase family protein [Actinomycetota bacterium]